MYRFRGLVVLVQNSDFRQFNNTLCRFRCPIVVGKDIAQHTLILRNAPGHCTTHLDITQHFEKAGFHGLVILVQNSDFRQHQSVGQLAGQLLDIAMGRDHQLLLAKVMNAFGRIDILIVGVA